MRENCRAREMKIMERGKPLYMREVNSEPKCESIKIERTTQRHAAPPVEIVSEL